jgi:hypothetical protein
MRRRRHVPHGVAEPAQVSVSGRGSNSRPCQICRIGAFPAFCFVIAERRRAPLAAASHEQRRGTLQSTGLASDSPLLDGNRRPPVGGGGGRWREAIRSVNPPFASNLQADI